MMEETATAKAKGTVAAGMVRSACLPTRTAPHRHARWIDGDARWKLRSICPTTTTTAIDTTLCRPAAAVCGMPAIATP